MGEAVDTPGVRESGAATGRADRGTPVSLAPLHVRVAEALGWEADG